VTLDPLIKVVILEERLDGHEKLCAERYGEISKSFDRVHGRLDWIMRGIVSLMAAMLAWLVTNGVPWFIR
jgi:hypothetical protein